MNHLVDGVRRVIWKKTLKTLKNYIFQKEEIKNGSSKEM